jgi:hypothetical protein
MIQAGKRAWQLEGFIYGMVSMGILALALVMLAYIVTLQATTFNLNSMVICRIGGICG